MRLLIAIAFGLFSVSHSVAAADNVPWLARVQSTYANELNGKDVRFGGAGFVAEYNGRYFVICDSHLSQGYKGLELSVGSKKLIAKSNARLADNDKDIEVIEIDPPGNGPVFHFNEADEFVIRRDEVNTWEKKNGFIQIANRIFVPLPSGLTKKPSAFHDTTIHERISYYSDKDSSRRAGLLKPSLGESELVSDSKIVEGMSGAPILFEGVSGRDGWLKLVVRGLTKAYHRYFDRSYFSTREQLAFLFKKFLAGERGLVSKTRWNYRGMTYRDYGNGTFEINKDIIQAGSGSGGDGGSGSGGDGGSGSGGDGGDTQNEESPAGLKAGITYEGQSTLAFEVVASRPGSISYSVYANPAGVAYIDRLEKEDPNLLTKAIRTESNLADLLKKRMAAAPKETGGELCAIDPDALERGVIRILLPPSKLNPLPARFLQLDVSGHIRGTDQKKFNPIIKLQEPVSKEIVTVDLKGLFFFDVDHAIYGNTSPDEFATSIKDVPYIIYRESDGGKDWLRQCTPSRERFKNYFDHSCGSCKQGADREDLAEVYRLYSGIATILKGVPSK